MNKAENIKTALVTGAAMRIGRQIALDLAGDGWAVIVHYAGSEEGADELVGEITANGGTAYSLAGDLANAGVVENLVNRAIKLIGPLSLLVNNASRFERDDVKDMTIAGWDLHMDINLRAPAFLAQKFADQLPENVSGNIINLIDQRVWRLNPEFFSYTVSKAALWDMTRTMAQALAPQIRVNAIGPGPALPSSRMDMKEFEKQCRLTPLGVGTSPEEISSALRFILSSPAMTGQMIALDGGQHLAWQTPDVVEVTE